MTSATASRSSTAGREFGVVLAVLVVAAGGLALACGRTWATVTVRVPGLPRTVLPVDGRALVPVAFALGLAALAGTLGLLATRGWGRRAVAVLVALCGLGATVAAAGGTAGDRTAVLAAAGVSGATPAGSAVTVTGSGWPWVTAVAALLVAAAGVVAVLRAPRWPAMGRRYEPPPAGSTAPTGASSASSVPPAADEVSGTGAAARTAPSDADLWRALDRGEDPTAR